MYFNKIITSMLVGAMPLCAYAQCSFTPTLNMGDTILCPNQSVTLATQVYDSYQWYANGSLIQGATSQSFNCAVNTYGGSYIKVLATRNGCSEFSDSVLVDGHAWLPMYIVHSVEHGYYLPNGVMCEGDTMTLTLGSSHTANVQWYRNNQPTPNATQPSLIVTQSGSYYPTAAPNVCPQLVETFSPAITATFVRPTSVQISLRNDTLWATPNNLSGYQWIKNNNDLVNETRPYLVPSGTGMYQVLTLDNCMSLSQPYNYVLSAVNEEFGESTLKIDYYGTSRQLHIHALQPVERVEIFNEIGALVHAESFAHRDLLYTLPTLPTGVYIARVATTSASKAIKILIP